ncbi:MAG TPA: tetratricopeptide repeat protein, partial [Chitinophagaceae bacterium]
SYSSNADARDAYNKGNDFLRQENYKDAAPWFQKAVAIDSEFAFAWDNLGICYRKAGEYDKAIVAYKNSLRVDPRGKTPLQNLAVVYQIQNKPDEAMATYNDILKYYPGDPETYYGIGLVYYSVKKDMVNALQNMCKAYNIYSNQKSPYRSDAEKVINLIYAEMKKNNQEDVFNQILKENNLNGN